MSNRNAFTLIELLVTVVVIGILAAIGIPKYTNSKTKAYVTTMKTDLRNLLNAEESFFADSAHYTTNIALLNFRPSAGATPPVITVSAGSWVATNGHTQMSGAQCGIGANTTNPVLGTAADGEPACK